MADLSSTSISQLLDNYFGPFIPNNISNLITIVADKGYSTIPSGNWLRDIVIHDPIVSPAKYKRDIFDCDDYVMYIKTRISLFAANKSSINRPLAVGFILTENHAFNFAITDTKHLFLLNTQSNNFDSLIPQTISDCANFLQLEETNPIKLIYI